MNEIPDPAIERRWLLAILAVCFVILLLKVTEPLLIQWLPGW